MKSNDLVFEKAINNTYSDKIIILSVLTEVYGYQLSKLLNAGRHTTAKYLDMLSSEGIIKQTNPGVQKPKKYRIDFAGEYFMKYFRDFLILKNEEDIKNFLGSNGGFHYLANSVIQYYYPLFQKALDGLEKEDLTEFNKEYENIFTGDKTFLPNMINELMNSTNLLVYVTAGKVFEENNMNILDTSFSKEEIKFLENHTKTHLPLIVKKLQHLAGLKIQ